MYSNRKFIVLVIVLVIIKQNVGLPSNISKEIILPVLTVSDNNNQIKEPFLIPIPPTKPENQKFELNNNINSESSEKYSPSLYTENIFLPLSPQNYRPNLTHEALSRSHNFNILDFSSYIQKPAPTPHAAFLFKEDISIQTTVPTKPESTLQNMQEKESTISPKIVPLSFLLKPLNIQPIQSNIVPISYQTGLKPIAEKLVAADENEEKGDLTEPPKSEDLVGDYYPNNFYEYFRNNFYRNNNDRYDIDDGARYDFNNVPVSRSPKRKSNERKSGNYRYGDYENNVPEDEQTDDEETELTKYEDTERQKQYHKDRDEMQDDHEKIQYNDEYEPNEEDEEDDEQEEVENEKESEAIVEEDDEVEEEEEILTTILPPQKIVETVINHPHTENKTTRGRVKHKKQQVEQNDYDDLPEPTSTTTTTTSQPKTGPQLFHSPSPSPIIELTTTVTEPKLLPIIIDDGYVIYHDNDQDLEQQVTEDYPIQEYEYYKNLIDLNTPKKSYKKPKQILNNNPKNDYENLPKSTQGPGIAETSLPVEEIDNTINPAVIDHKPKKFHSQPIHLQYNSRVESPKPDKKKQKATYKSPVVTTEILHQQDAYISSTPWYPIQDNLQLNVDQYKPESQDQNLPNPWFESIANLKKHVDEISPDLQPEQLTSTFEPPLRTTERIFKKERFISSTPWYPVKANLNHHEDQYKPVLHEIELTTAHEPAIITTKILYQQDKSVSTVPWDPNAETINPHDQYKEEIAPTYEPEIKPTESLYQQEPFFSPTPLTQPEENNEFIETADFPNQNNEVLHPKPIEFHQTEEKQRLVVTTDNPTHSTHIFHIEPEEKEEYIEVADYPDNNNKRSHVELIPAYLSAESEQFYDTFEYPKKPYQKLRAEPMQIKLPHYYPPPPESYPEFIPPTTDLPLQTEKPETKSRYSLQIGDTPTHERLQEAPLNGDIKKTDYEFVTIYKKKRNVASPMLNGKFSSQYRVPKKVNVVENDLAKALKYTDASVSSSKSQPAVVPLNRSKRSTTNENDDVTNDDKKQKPRPTPNPQNVGRILSQVNYFQDFFTAQLTPDILEFGHLCENPNDWEERFERKDTKEHRHQGKVRWGDKKGGFGEHVWDLNHHKPIVSESETKSSDNGVIQKISSILTNDNLEELKNN